MEFLTEEELAAYTGYQRPAEQIEWLKANKLVPFTINGKNKPVVIFKHVFGFRRDEQDSCNNNAIDTSWNPDPARLPLPSKKRSH